MSKVLRARAKALVLSPPCLHLKRMIYGRCVWIVGPLIRSQSIRKYAQQVSWNKGVLQNRLGRVGTRTIILEWGLLNELTSGY